MHEILITNNDPRLTEYSKGGNVNLNLRPMVPTEELNSLGYDAGKGIATIFSTTVSNAAGNVAMNFTPIVANPTTGEFISIVDPQTFEQYCSSVVEGATDQYGIKIGKTFTGENCIQEAVAVANDIHKIHEYYLNLMFPKMEYDFFYRARYGAEFPWTLEDEGGGGGDVPGVPQILGTLATAGEKGSNNKTVENSENAKITDIVTLAGLEPWWNYKLRTTVYDKTNKKFVSIINAVERDSEGNIVPPEEEPVDQIVGSDTELITLFSLEETNGDAEVGIEIDTTELSGHTLVIFQELFLEDDFLSEHKEENDKDQTVYVAKIAEEPVWDLDDYGGYAVVVDDNFIAKGIVETYESLIWTDRYDEAGDFELYTLVDPDLLNLLSIDTYFYIKESDHYMIVEKIEISSDPDQGDKLRISGRSLESILQRRVVWRQTEINGNLQNGIHQLLNENVIRPSNDERRIANFIFKESTDPRITKLTMDASYFGDNLYDVICNLCKSNHIGFKIILDSQNRFIFSLFAGIDRSYDNKDNNIYLIFGPEYDNVVNSNFVHNKENYKNVARVSGGEDKLVTDYGGKKWTGLSRRETYISASDIDRDKMSESGYKNALQQKGKDELVDYHELKTADGTMSTQSLKYIDDFYLGDIIEFKDLYGNEAKSRITEVIISRNDQGFTIYPTFDAVNEEEEL